MGVIAALPWSLLCAPATEEFFSRYPRYVQVDISATTVLEHRRWFGWCESRLRLLISSLEQPPFMYCHPHANCFHRQEPVDPPKGEQEKECRPNDANTRPEVDEEDENMCGSKLESEAGVDANNFLYTSSFFIGLSFKNGLRSADLTVAAQVRYLRVLAMCMHQCHHNCTWFCLYVVEHLPRIFNGGFGTGKVKL